MRGIAPSLTLIVVGALALTASDATLSAEKKCGPGVTDTEIKIGQTIAYSGPASSFGTTGHTRTYPWTMAGDLSFVNETRAFARFVIEDKPDAKIGILYQNDDYGKDHINGLNSGLGDKAASMIIAEVPYESTDPTVDSQMVQLKASGADVLVEASLPKFAAQSIRKVYDIG
jgi:branched-chain amino acid transport system substrate-binding protein